VNTERGGVEGIERMGVQCSISMYCGAFNEGTVSSLQELVPN
jgi:hypothetical protein